MGSFGDRLRKARAAAELTQDQLGFAVGLSKQAVAAWESGRTFPGFDVWPKIRAALGVSLDDLICGDAAAASAAHAGFSLMDGEPPGHVEKRPAIQCARDAKELALLLHFRTLATKRQQALLELLKP